MVPYAATQTRPCSHTHRENTCGGSSRTFFPLPRRTRRLRRSPLHTVRPVGRGHLANGDVAGVTRLERTALALRLVRLHPLLAETNRLDLVALLGHHHMALGRMRRRALRLVEPTHTRLFQTRVGRIALGHLVGGNPRVIVRMVTQHTRSPHTCYETDAHAEEINDAHGHRKNTPTRKTARSSKPENTTLDPGSHGKSPHSHSHPTKKASQSTTTFACSKPHNAPTRAANANDRGPSQHVARDCPSHTSSIWKARSGKATAGTGK